MFDKINISRIITDHFGTFRSFRTKRYSTGDFILFLGLPAIVAGILLFFQGTIDNYVTQILATVLAVFAALLFNLLLLNYDVVRKVQGDRGDEKYKERIQYLKEIFSNISFAILTALLGLILLLVQNWVSGSCDFQIVVSSVVSCVIYYIITMFVLTLFMVLKRVHILLSDEIKW